jgi:hypothetical protein
MCSMIKRFIYTVLFVTFFLIGVNRVSASIFGEENAILGKMLIEDIQHTFHLKNLVGFATSQVKVLNEKYGYEKWLNQGLDEVKDFGLLSELKTDDYIIGTFQRDMDKLGYKYQGENFQLDNMNEWVDQLWELSPEEVNSKAGLRDKVTRTTAEMALEHYLWNLNYNNKIRNRYNQLQSQATIANPGLSSRLTAQTNVLQSYQLSNINDTQNRVLQLMAIKQLENLQQKYETQSYFKESFNGISGIFNSMK